MPSLAQPKILLLGAGGQLGLQLAGQLHGNVTALTRAQLDLSDIDAVRETVRSVAPQIVINAAAYTAVDKAESEPDIAALVNGVAPAAIADELALTGGWLIHYSTDYVFDGSGSTPWRETDPTHPLNAYGRSKCEGEEAIAATGANHIILRTSWVYAAEGRNFLHTMLRLGRERDELKIVADQIGAPTSAEALTAATRAVLKRLEPAFAPDSGSAQTEIGKLSGLYHLACSGETSWCGFAEAIFAAFADRQKPPRLIPIPTEAYPTPAKRPHNSRLNCSKFAAAFDYAMPTWQAALETVVSELKSHQ
ncbi:MAG TPA: dTDP-4-dehydrorhamnose reductase [Acidobacteriaceae bacterium]